MKLNPDDMTALRKLTDFEIAGDGASAAAAGDMKITVARSDDNNLQVTIELPNGSEFSISLERGGFPATKANDS